jgi:hypothetical protein
LGSIFQKNKTEPSANYMHLMMKRRVKSDILIF